MKPVLFLLGCSFAACTSSKTLHNPYDAYPYRESRNGLQVGLGYATYEGQTTEGISSWLGVRFGASTGGNARFQAPRVPKPVKNADAVPAQSSADACSQILFGSYIGSEDCLFLNVFAPEDAKDLPVFVFIHGGAYQGGQAGGSDPVDLIVNNDNRFIAVMVQYRLGVFGFLGTQNVKEHGQLNAGLLDMELSLQWIQKYIHLFGGNPRKVTIAGESAGGGAVMLMSLLRGGRLGDSLFQQVIGSSPYLPKQFDYDGAAPKILYKNVSSVLDCNKGSGSFDCLVKADAKSLCQAGFDVDNDPRYNQYIWGFVPVTDGTILQDLPSQQLLHKRTNGKRLLVGYNSNEGSTFTPQGINTENDFDNYLDKYLPYTSAYERKALKKAYPTTHDTDPSLLNYDTNGRDLPNVNSMSDWSNGQQQRAFNLLGEALFICPSYWLAEAFPQAWKYEFAVSPAYHSYDTGAYFFTNQTHPAFTDDFAMAFQNMWGNFIVHGNPRISRELACGSACDSDPSENTEITHWPRYTEQDPTQLIVNTTGGQPGNCQLFTYSLRCAVGPGLENKFTLTNARDWQGGRGDRCDLWQRIGPSVPE